MWVQDYKTHNSRCWSSSFNRVFSNRIARSLIHFSYCVASVIDKRRQYSQSCQLSCLSVSRRRVDFALVARQPAIALTDISTVVHVLESRMLHICIISKATLFGTSATWRSSQSRGYTIVFYLCSFSLHEYDDILLFLRNQTFSKRVDERSSPSYLTSLSRDRSQKQSRS